MMSSGGENGCEVGSWHGQIIAKRKFFMKNVWKVMEVMKNNSVLKMIAYPNYQ